MQTHEVHTDTVPYRSIWTQMLQISFRHGWVDAGGIRTRFIEAGRADRPAVLFLHGTAGSLEAFAFNIAAHAEHFHVFAIDLVGAGYSDRPDMDYEISSYVSQVRAFMRAMSIEQASLTGVSLGAWIAARFALDHPEATRSITLLSASGLVANEATMKEIKSIRTNAVEDPSWDNIKKVLLNLLHKKELLIDDLIAVRRAIYSQEGMKQAMAHTLCLQNPAIRTRNLLTEAQWRAVSVPALVIGSLQDHADYLGTARYVADLMPHSAYREIPDVGHWPQFEAAEVFDRLSVEFLRQLPG